MKKGIIILGVIVIVLALGAWFLGLFDSATVMERQEGGYVTAGIEFTGPYDQIGGMIDKSDSTLKTLGIENQLAFGIYYNNPQNTPEEELRSYVGMVVPKDKKDLLDEIQNAGLKVDSIGKGFSLVIELPIRSMLTYFIGPMKAYPKLNAHMEEQGYEQEMIYEIYDGSAEKALYVMKCSR